jgi:hypothetical protein
LIRITLKKLNFVNRNKFCQFKWAVVRGWHLAPPILSGRLGQLVSIVRQEWLVVNFHTEASVMRWLTPILPSGIGFGDINSTLCVGIAWWMPNTGWVLVLAALLIADNKE